MTAHVSNVYDALDEIKKVDLNKIEITPADLMALEWLIEE